MTLTFSIINQKLTRTDNLTIASDSKKYLRAMFTFTSDWQETEKTAQFSRGGEPYDVILDSKNSCLVPQEVLDSGVFSLTVYGIGADEKRITSTEISIKVERSGLMNGSVPTEPTPDVYEQLMAKMQSINQSILEMDVAIKANTDSIQELYAKIDEIEQILSSEEPETPIEP